jgi:ABC-type transport system involved in cytochrome c biogenesis ATPase subunit
LTVETGLLDEPLKLKPGDIVALRGPSRRNCSVLLRGIAASDRLDGIRISWESDSFIDRQNGPNYLLYLARPAVLRMTLAENLSLLSDAECMADARLTVLNNPLLSPAEKAAADELVNDIELSISDRARYAVARVLMTSRPVVLIDMFFNMMEVDDQITFLREFRTRFPERILVLNAFDPAIDPHLSRVVTVKGNDV